MALELLTGPLYRQLPYGRKVNLLGLASFYLAAFSSAVRSRDRPWIWHITFVFGSFWLAISHYLELEGGRKPPPAHLSLPPRELILEVQISRIFNSSKGSKTISGLGLIQGIQQIRQDLIGKRIHFRLNPLASGQECLSGDFLKATGILYPIKDKQVGTFHKHLVSRGIHYELRRGQFIEKTEGVGSFKVFCHNANKRFEEFLRRGAEPDDETAAGIGVAMLLGKKAAIPPDQKDRFILAGAMHLFAISGLHVAIVAGLFILLLRLLLGPRWAETTLDHII